MADKIIIQLLQSNHFPQVIALANEQLGDGYITDHFLQSFWNNTAAHVKVILDQDEVIGFYIVYLHPVWLQEDLKTSDSQNFAVLKTIVVSEQYQRRGIGNLLMEDFLNWSKTNHFQQLFSIAWQRKESVPVENLLRKNGFEITHAIVNYWQQESEMQQYTCPECGQPPCTCTAVIFKKELVL